MTNSLPPALPASRGALVRRIVGIALIYVGPAVVVGTLFTAFTQFGGRVDHASLPLLALGYVLMLVGWLILPGRLGTRIGAAGIALAAMLVGANTVPMSRFVGLDVTLQLGGLAGTVFGTGPLGALALALATTAMLFAWLRVRGRGGLAHLALIPLFLVQLVFGLIVAAWSFGQFAAFRWPVVLATAFSNSTLPSGLAAALGAILGWALLVGGSAWLAIAIDRAVARERARRAEREAARPAAASGAVGVTPTNTMAILALVFAFIVSILGIVFGHVARGQIRRSGEAGYGLATAGMIIGYVQVGLGLVAGIAYAVLLASVLNGMR